uniref:Putative ovule protein n=1 Tax=Solanum chacoense TaxID=4108 RepID=A0A0V0GMQ1_SOLCH
MVCRAIVSSHSQIFKSDMIGPARRWICIDNHASDAELHISWHIIYASHACLSALLVSDDAINKRNCEDPKAEGRAHTQEGI